MIYLNTLILWTFIYIGWYVKRFALEDEQEIKIGKVYLLVYMIYNIIFLIYIVLFINTDSAQALQRYHLEESTLYRYLTLCDYILRGINTYYFIRITNKIQEYLNVNE